MLNNPIKFNDPTGHGEDCGIGEPGCNAGTSTQQQDQSGSIDKVLAGYGINLDKNSGFTADEKRKILRAAWDIGRAIAATLKKSPSEAFRSVYSDGVSFVKSDKTCQEALGENCWGNTVGTTITIYSNAKVQSGGYNNFLVHEMGHAFDNVMGNQLSSGYSDRVVKSIPSASNPNPWTTMPVGNAGFKWTEGDPTYMTEEAADMFLGWVYGKWADNISGKRRSNWMGLWMPYLINDRKGPPLSIQYNCNEDTGYGC